MSEVTERITGKGRLWPIRNRAYSVIMHLAFDLAMTVCI